MGKGKLKRLHETLTKDGYDVPDYASFEKDMADREKLGRLHKTLLSDNYDIPDFETFSLDMGFGGVATSKQPTPEKKKTTPSFGEFGNFIFKFASAGKEAQKAQQTTQQSKNEKRPSFADLEATLNESRQVKQELELAKQGSNITLRSLEMGGAMSGGSGSIAGFFARSQPGNTPEDIKAKVPGLERKSQWATQKLKYQSEVLKPEFEKLQQEIGENFQQFYTKDGLVDTEKILNKADELSKQYGGGQNVKEIFALRIKEYAEQERHKPAVVSTFSKNVQKQFGKSPQQVLQETPPEQQQAVSLQLQKMYEQAAKTVADSDAQSKSIIAKALGNTPYGNSAKSGMALFSGLNNSIASMGEGLASLGINNKFTDAVRGFETGAERFTLPDNELTFKNILTDPGGTIATRVARQVGTQLPMLAATVALRSPALGTALGFSSESLSLMGETYKEVLKNTGNPAEARAKSMEMLRTQALMAPTYYFQADNLLKLAKGAKRALVTGGLEMGNDLLQEEVQGLTQANLAGREFGIDEALDTAGETIVAGGGMTAGLAAVGKAYKAIASKAPNVQEQHLFGVLQNMGYEGAVKHLEQLRSMGQISIKDFEKGVAKAKQMEASRANMQRLNIDDDAQLATVAFTSGLNELTKQLETETNETVRARLTEKVNEAKKQIADIQAGNGDYAIVQVNGGGRFAIPMQEVGSFLDQEKDNISDGTTLVQLKGKNTVDAFGARLQQMNDAAVAANGTLSKEQQAEVEAMMAAINEEPEVTPSRPQEDDSAGETATPSVEAIETEAADIKPDANVEAAAETTPNVQAQESGPMVITPNQQAAAAQQKSKEQALVIGTKSPKTVQYENGERVIVTQGGKKVDPESDSGKRILREHAKAYDYNFGETMNDDMWPNDVMTINQAATFVAQNSSNPAEIAATYLTMEDGQPQLSSKDASIADAETNTVGPIKITASDFARYGDRNNLNQGIGRFRISKEARPLDVVAQEMSWALGDESGTLVTPQDLVDYATRFPIPGSALRKVAKTPEHATVEDRFYELTGIPLTPAIAKIAASQLMERPTPAQIAMADSYPVDIWEQLINEEIENLTEYEQYEQQPAERGEDISPTGTEQGATAPAVIREVEGAVDEAADAVIGERGETGSSEGANRGTQPAIPAGIAKITEAIDNMFDGVEGYAGVDVLEGKEFNEAVQKATGSDMMVNADSDIYGFVTPEGRIVLNGRLLNPNTPIHEASHLFTRWAKQNAPAMYNAMMQVVQGTAYMQQVQANPFYKQQADGMRANGATEAEVQEMFADEALATAVGDKGAALALGSEEKTAFEKLLQRFWNTVKNLFGSKAFEQMTADDFSNMTFEQFATGMAERILSGKKVQGNTKGGDSRFQVAGVKGASNLDASEGVTTRMDNLQVASDMEAAGKDAATIRMATGWEKGVDGMWRYEIPDAFIKSNVLDRASKFFGKDVFVDFGFAEDVLTEDVLNAYPELGKKIKVQGARVSSERGSFIANENGEGAITIALDLVDSKEDFNIVLVHEVQHAIQKIEGFAKGASPSMFTDSPQLSADQRLFVEGAMATPPAEALQRLDEMEAAELFSPQEAQTIRDAINSGPEALRALLRTAFDQYQATAGEVEARNVQDRIGMTPEQRRQATLESTESIPRSQQSVRFQAAQTAQQLTDIEQQRQTALANATKPKITATFIANSKLQGVTVEMDVEVAETGAIEKVSMSAIQAQNMLKKRERILKQLIDCLG